MESSCTIWVATMRKPDFFRTSTTAGPEKSTRSPREQESLTVTTAAVRGAGVGRPAVDASAVEEDIFFLFSPAAAAWGSAAAAGSACGVGRSVGSTAFRDRRLPASIAL